MFKEEYQRLWEKTTKEYVIITDINRNVIAVSSNVNRLFKDMSFPDTYIDYFAKAKHNEILEYQNKKYRVQITRIEDRCVVIFRDCTVELKMKSEMDNLENLAKNYEMLFDNFGNSKEDFQHNGTKNFLEIQDW